MHRNQLFWDSNDGERIPREQCLCFGGKIWLEISKDENGNLTEFQFVKAHKKKSKENIGLFYEKGILVFRSCCPDNPESFTLFNQWKNEGNREYDELSPDEQALFCTLEEMYSEDDKNSYELEKWLEKVIKKLTEKMDVLKFDKWVEKTNKFIEKHFFNTFEQLNEFGEILSQGLKIHAAIKALAPESGKNEEISTLIQKAKSHVSWR